MRRRRTSQYRPVSSYANRRLIYATCITCAHYEYYGLSLDSNLDFIANWCEECEIKARINSHDIVIELKCYL